MLDFAVAARFHGGFPGWLVVVCGKGHHQISGHGCRVDYYPLSKRRTVFCNGKTTKDCSPYDAIKICQQNGVSGIKPKKRDISKNVVAGSVAPVKSPTLVKHLYCGERPPWEFPTMVQCVPDMLRIEAHQLTDKARKLVAMR